MPYRILILPNVERIPLATLQKIAEYAVKGGTVIATRRRPSLAPGLMEADRDTPQIRELAANLKLVDDESKLGEALAQRAGRQMWPPPPKSVSSTASCPYADIYFLVNTCNRPVKTDATFRMPPRGVYGSQWDPLTGKVSTAGGTRLDLDLAPYESRVHRLQQGRRSGPCTAHRRLP